MLGAKARAALQGRYFANTDDIRAVAYPVLRHRIVTNFNAEAEGVKADELIRRLIDAAGDAGDGERRSASLIEKAGEERAAERIMETESQLFDARMLARLHGLPLRARQKVEGHVCGMHRSPFHGFSIEFAEHREYAPGDDLRYLDWKVFGRTDKYYLKRFEEDSNLVCHVLLDASESMAVPERGLAPWSKLDYAKRAAAALIYLILHQQDSAGLVVFDNEIRTLLRAQQQPFASEGDFAVDWTESRRREKTATGVIFHDLAERLKRRGLVIVLSDMFDDLGPTLAGLKHLRHRRHEVIVMHVLDPAEIEFPFDEPTLFCGMEQLPDCRH